MARATKRCIGLSFLLASIAFRAVTLASADDRESIRTPNYQQAMQYNNQYVRQFVYDTSVTPHWIGKTDTFWYSFRTSEGTRYWRVNPGLRTKEPLFDSAKLSSLLSEAVQKPLDAGLLPLQRVTMNDEGTKLKFVVDDFQYEYELTTEKLAKLGKAPPAPPPTQNGQVSREDFERRREEFQRLREEQQQQQDQEQRRDQQDEQQRVDQQQEDQQQRQGEREQQDNQQRTENRGPGQTNGPPRITDHRNWSPDRKSYVFAKGHNLFYVELKPEDAKKEETKTGDQPSDESKDKTEKKADEKKADDSSTQTKSTEKADEDKKGESKTEDSKKTDDSKKDEKKQGDDKGDGNPQGRRQGGDGEQAGPRGQGNLPPIPRIDPKLDDTAIQLTEDGVEDYSFAGGGGGFGFGRGNETGTRGTPPPITPDRKTRPNVSWSRDSKAFYVTRSDSRGVQDLWVINSLATPRPTLEKYKYPMPGEPAIRKSELFTFTRDSKKLVRMTPHWKDENYSNTHFGKSGDEFRFIRRDRLLRHIEFCAINLASGEAKCLVTEGFENANILTLSYRYLEDTDEMIWWSERSGWGHFYLYDRNGTLKNPITSGTYHASRLVDVDTKNRLLYFTANGREPSENIYFEHLYSVRLDGTGLTLMDPGNATHRSTLSPSKQFVVDNCSRVDVAPRSILREASGKELVVLEEADLSRLAEAGWRLPETFTVKAADGVTDLYGNMWKPFDFDPNKKYPIIVNVYPGPQTEGVTHTFASTSGTMQLAQLGFIVVQVGHRGGAPNRSKAYGSFGYFNLRDYGLADKKYAIEQLAARHAFIDLNRVGIYGHSGGGFMTAAALLQKPYNDFFKVGIATSGNHDNNIYNNSWSERYHGLKEVEVKDEQQSQATGRGTRGTGQGTGGSRGLRQQRQGEGAWDVLQTEDWDSIDEEEALEELLSVIDPAWTPPPRLAPIWGGRNDGQPLEPAQQEGKETKADENTKAQETKSGEMKSDEKSDEKKASEEKKTKFEISVPTNQELAANLKGHLLLVHGEIDNNVHPANTMRLVDALIKADKRFDMLIIPGKRHAYADYQPYVTQRMWEYFAEHLMSDRQSSADIYVKAPPDGSKR
jgi:dipeptidyl-peptidase-4